METMNLKEAKTHLSRVVESASQGQAVTITRHGKPVAAVVSMEWAEAARAVLAPAGPTLTEYLRTIPDVPEFARNPSAARDASL
jgi:prevent-host-death family protein